MAYKKKNPRSGTGYKESSKHRVAKYNKLEPINVRKLEQMTASKFNEIKLKEIKHIKETPAQKQKRRFPSKDK